MVKQIETVKDTPQDDSRSMARSSAAVSGATLVSRILGLVRDKGLILVFGAHMPLLDAFLFAFTIPNLFRRVFGEGAMASALIPVFVEHREKKSPEETGVFASQAFSMLFFATAVLSVLGILGCMGAAALLPLGPDNALFVRLLAMMLPFLCLVCTSALIASMLQGLRRFFLPSLMSVVLNLAFLAALAWIIHSHWPVNAGFGWSLLSNFAASLDSAEAQRSIRHVAFAVVAAGAVQIAVQWVALSRQGIRLRPTFQWKSEGVSKVLKALGPTALGLGVVQINVLIDNVIAYWLSATSAPGATTYLYLGNRLMQLPLGIFGIAVATTAFPYLARHVSRNDWEGLVRTGSNAARRLAFIILPAAFGLIVMADPIMRLLYQEPAIDQFPHASVYRASAVLACYASGLIFYSLQHLLTRIFYAQGDYRTPVRIAMAMVGINLVLNLLLIRAPDLFLRWSGIVIPGLEGHTALAEAGLALATAITAGLQVIVLWGLLRKTLLKRINEDRLSVLLEEIPASFFRIVVASAVMGALVYLTRNSIPWEPEFLMRFERCIVPIVVGIGGYALLCLVIPVPELGEFFGKKKQTTDENKKD